MAVVASPRTEAALPGRACHRLIGSRTGTVTSTGASTSQPAPSNSQSEDILQTGSHLQDGSKWSSPPSRQSPDAGASLLALSPASSQHGAQLADCLAHNTCSVLPSPGQRVPLTSAAPPASPRVRSESPPHACFAPRKKTPT